MSETSIHKRRIRFVIVLVGIVGILVIARLFSLQIVLSDKYKERAEHQYVTPSGDSFDRGSIYFSKKDGTTLAAATIESGFKLAIAPARVTDPMGTYTAISSIIALDQDQFLASAAKKNDPYEEVAQRISQKDAQAINTLNLPGVTLYRQKWRYYPGEEMAAKVIGFVSYKNNTLVGNYGIESFYNDVLSRSADSFYVNFFAEIFANVQSTVFKNTASVGDVVTTIEPAVQAQLENAVQATRQRWSSGATGAVVMDPYTGEILALAHVPSFDLNNYGKVDDVSVYNNPLVQSDYEMGSIIKPLVMAAAIDAGAVTPETTYTDNGSVQVQDKVIKNFDGKGRGRVDMQDVLNQSLNTGMVFVQQRMKKSDFREYLLEKFKLGEKTGIDLPGEVRGLTGNLKDNNDVNYANAAFGQGLAITPISVVRGFAVLANGGYVVTPHVAKAIEEQNGRRKVLEYPKSTEAVLKPETVETMKQMLVTVVDEGYNRKSDWRVAAKTGTAQIAKPGGQGYYDDRNMHSLIGFFPASKPRFVIYFFNYHPKGISFASQSLADPFFDMVHFLANYYQIAPDR